MQDRHGNKVVVGDVVRVIEIDPNFLAALPEAERPRIEAMLNNEFAVDELPSEVKASVSISWEENDGTVAFSGLYMLSHECELVRACECE